jgi:hypothetical protein
LPHPAGFACRRRLGLQLCSQQVAAPDFLRIGLKESLDWFWNFLCRFGCSRSGSFLFALQALQGMAKQCAAQTSTGGSELIRVPIQRL